MVARSDFFSSTRKSITAVTSSWADGTRGPLGLCYATGSFKLQDVERFNAQYATTGEALLFDSESRSHFMSGQTYMTLLHNLIGPAFHAKRRALGLPATARGLLLTDAWSGFHCHRGGLEAARQSWSIQFNVELPALQV